MSGEYFENTSNLKYCFQQTNKYAKFNAMNVGARRQISLLLLSVPAPCISESCIKIKISLNFYFHTSLWCFKRFLKAPQRNVKIKI